MCRCTLHCSGCGLRCRRLARTLLQQIFDASCAPLTGGAGRDLPPSRQLVARDDGEPSAVVRVDPIRSIGGRVAGHQCVAATAVPSQHPRYLSGLFDRLIADGRSGALLVVL